jgi:hypothetical protein
MCCFIGSGQGGFIGFVFHGEIVFTVDIHDGFASICGDSADEVQGVRFEVQGFVLHKQKQL